MRKIKKKRKVIIAHTHTHIHNEKRLNAVIFQPYPKYVAFGRWKYCGSEKWAQPHTDTDTPPADKSDSGAHIIKSN